jgi:hypothetical protein
MESETFMDDNDDDRPNRQGLTASFHPKAAISADRLISATHLKAKGMFGWCPGLALPNVGKNWLAKILAKESLAHTWPNIW